jgi:hypothetical protein
MIPVNRIKRWPFPGNPALNTLGENEELRVEGEEMLSVFGALTMALGNRDGKKVFEFLKRIASETAERAGGGVPCIYFKDAMGEFIGIEEDLQESGDEDSDGMTDDGLETGPDDAAE